MKELKLLLKRSIFKRYFISCSFAYIGINMGLIGINWYIIDQTSSNGILAQYSIVTILATIVTSLFIGNIVDKYNKSVLMKGSCICQALIVYVLFWILNYTNNFITIYGIAIINSIGLSLFGTASRSILSDIIVERKLLIQGNSILEICMQLGAIFSAGITGLLYDFFGIHIIICIMSVSLIVSALAMKFVSKCTSIYVDRKTDGRLNYNKSNILFLGLITFIPYIVTLLSNNILPGYVNIHLRAPSMVYGVSDMLYGIGALTAGCCAGLLCEMFRKDIEVKLFIISFAILSLLYFNTNTIVLFIIYFLFGLTNTLLKIYMNTHFMRIVPNEIYGKCYALMNSFASIIQIFVLVALGQVLDIYGTKVGYVILALIMLMDGILWFIINKIWHIEVKIREE